MVRDERFEGRILRSDQPRGWANMAIDAIAKIAGKIFIGRRIAGLAL
jgi:hypothetical protein